MEPITLGLLTAAAWWFWKQKQAKKEATRANFRGSSGTTWQTLVDSEKVTPAGKIMVVDVVFPLPTADTKLYPFVLRYEDRQPPPGVPPTGVRRVLLRRTADPKYQQVADLAQRDFSVAPTRTAGVHLMY